MKSPFSDFMSLLYPRVCINCHRGLTKTEEHLCLSCELSLPKCEHLTNKTQLKQKFAFQPKVSGAYAYLDYLKDGIVQNLIHCLKYKGKQQLGVWLGQRFGQEIKPLLDESIDMIVPIPLHPKRMRTRGYNQSDRIAEGMGSSMEVPIGLNVAVRSKETKTQTRKAKISRWENMESVFKVMDRSSVSQKNLLIVDDVITTGATLGAFCDEVAKYDPNSITIAALASGK